MAKQDLTPLVIKAQQGNKAALEDLISQCYQDIYYFAFKTVKNEDLASDITQESCMEIITTLDKLREPGASPITNAPGISGKPVNSSPKKTRTEKPSWMSCRTKVWAHCRKRFAKTKSFRKPCRIC